MPPALRVESLWKCYAAGVSGCSARVWALRGVSFTIDVGERVAIVGGPGAGKTTLARCIAGSRVPTAGLIEIAARVEIVDLSATGRAEMLEIATAAAPARADELSHTRIVLSRDMNLLRAWPDRVLYLRDGRLTDATPRPARRVAEPRANAKLSVDLVR